MILPRRLVTVTALVGLAAAGCDRKEKKGLPAATDWQSPALGSAPPVPRGAGPSATGGGGGDPHAGVPGAPPLGGGGDPHAGVPGAPPLTDEQMQAGAAGGDPHAGVPGAPPLDDSGGAAGGTTGGDPSMQLPPPAADRPIDPSKYLAGTIALPPASEGKIPSGAAIFLSVRPADNPAGMPIAVDKLVATGSWPLSFRITEAQAMTAGTAFAGPVVISARFDQDGEARSKQPGDISGIARATIPAEGLVINLDTIQP
jgi:hypothetical protein